MSYKSFFNTSGTLDFSQQRCVYFRSYKKKIKDFQKPSMFSYGSKNDLKKAFVIKLNSCLKQNLNDILP